jgi:hypothetical protein
MAVVLKKLSAEEHIAEHKRIRARGMGLFILFRGVLGFGLFTFLIDLSSSSLLEHRHIDFDFLVGKAFQWFASGLFFGWFMWRIEYDPDEDERESVGSAL